MKPQMTHPTRARKHSAPKRSVPQPADTGDGQENQRALPARLDADTRRAMIAEAAYYRAEQRGFEPGRELEDWHAAESDVDSMPRPFDSPSCCGP
jgi:Protein of unknown function (DUF2934)